MNNRFNRLLKPASIAVFGGEWAASVVEQCRAAGFEGPIWPVHPTRDTLGGEPCFSSLAELPGIPDACFIGVNKDSTIELVEQLAVMGVGGAICFAAGFGESDSQDTDGDNRQNRLIKAAGQMPIIGPNCYGLINYLDKVTLWPDQHGGKPVERGVAIVTQSSNIATNLSMQQRGLPIAFLLTAGNQAQSSLAELAAAVISDERVTALGLHIEGFSDIRAFEDLATQARRLGKRVVILKTGVTPQARVALMSHTRSLSGNDVAASTFIERLGMCRARGIGEFIETLKLLNLPRKVGGTKLLSMSCSGGEAALVSDMAVAAGLEFPDLDEQQISSLKAVLGDGVPLANPLDYQVRIWDQRDEMEAMVASMLKTGQSITGQALAANDQCRTVADVAILLLDFPRPDRSNPASWQKAAEAFVAASQHWPGVSVVLATLPENLPEATVEYLLSQGVVGLCGIGDGMRALYNAAMLETANANRTSQPVWMPASKSVPLAKVKLSLVDGGTTRPDAASARQVSEQAWGLGAAPEAGTVRRLDESTSKRWLNRFNVAVPVNLRLSFADVRSSRRLARALDKASPTFTYPVVAKGLGFVHKSEVNAIELGIENRRDLERAVQRIDCAGGLLIEEQVQGPLAELLVSVVQDPVHGLLMTIGAGGVSTEILKDTVHCLVPASRDELDRRIGRLRCAPLLEGFRGRKAVDRECLLDALEAVQEAALQLGERLIEMEINPLLCTATQCVAVDAYVAVTE